jgi:CBS domain-containing protein
MTTRLLESPVVTARDVMSGWPVVADVDDSVPELFDRMHRAGVRHLVVVANGRCLGVVDDRRVVVEWVIGTLVRSRRAIDLLPPTCTWVAPETPLDEVARLLVADPRGALPVLTDDGAILGIVTASDVLRRVGRGSASKEAAPCVPAT